MEQPPLVPRGREFKQGTHALDKLPWADPEGSIERIKAEIKGEQGTLFDPNTKGIAQDSPMGGYIEEPLPDKLDLLAHHAGQILDNVAKGWRDLGHMQDTPLRYAKMILELTQREDFKFTTFEATSDEMIILGPIPFYTLCAHHVIPFYGNAFVGYVPDKLIAGLSKFARLVQWAAKGLWVQEELTSFIAEELEGRLRPRGVAVILEGEHLCMAMRGVKQPGVVTTTSSMRGVFGDHTRTAKAEFMQLIEGKRKHG